ncbi:MAG TPA: metallophosphoesterase [Thermoleophilaceae bacterium]|nr:metallophosphoesterase [Thermoleophilaceae bacterium]
MTPPSRLLGAEPKSRATIRVAAAGDIHCDESSGPAAREAFAALEGSADLVLLAGDLTTHGEPRQAAVLADACRELSMPAAAVLGNHDHHAGRGDEVAAILAEAGVDVLDRRHATYSVAGCHVGVAGIKGFVGGFHGLGLPDFGEPSLRAIYAETGAEAEALAEGLTKIALCPFRIALLHYAPLSDTLRGEPTEIWAFLGSDRLAAPLLEHRPDLVLHGHAHAGTFEASLDGVPVHNVSVPVIGRDFWIFELESAEHVPGALH